MQDLGLFELWMGISALKKFRQRFVQLGQQTSIPPALRSDLERVVAGLERDLAKLECSNSLIAAQRLRKLLKSSHSNAKFVSCIDDLRARCKDELRGKTVYYIDDRSVEPIKRDRELWDKIMLEYPNATKDIEEGFWCLAIDRYTASVFHMMRAAEWGMRALARERKVRLPKNKPIDHGNWQEIISALDAEVKIVGKRKAGPAKTAALAFYGHALADLNRLKDGYRNDVMHSRGAYIRSEAESCLFHVRSFMKTLSERIGEDHKGRISWGKT